MDEKKARQLITKLVNAAYEAGLHSTNPNSLFVEFWKEKAEKMVDELVYHLSDQSSGPDETERCPKCGSTLGHYPNCPNGICSISICF